MKKFFKKTIISFLILCMFSTANVFAINQSYSKNTNDNNIFNVIETKSGRYEIYNDKYDLENNPITLIQGENDDIYHSYSNPNKIFIRVKENIFLEAKKEHIDLKNKAEIDSVIEKYKIEGILADDLKKLHNEFIDQPNNIEVNLYIPVSNEKVISFKDNYETPIYRGYGGLRYYDIILDLKGDSNFHRIRELSDTASSIANIVLNTFVSGLEIDDMKIGTAYTLLEIFGSVFTVYPTSASITTTVSSVESKTKKYTYVEDLYYPDTFICRAVSERGWQYFEHCIATPGYPKEYSSNNLSFYHLPNYSNLDEKAYRYRTGGGLEIWVEQINYFRINDYTAIRSIGS